MKYIIFSLIFISVFLIAVLSSKYVSKEFSIKESKTMAIFVAVSLIYTLLLLYFFGVSAITVKGLILLFILLISSAEDFKTHQCADYIHIMIIISAFIGTKLKQIPEMLLCGAFVMALMLVTVIITKSEIGGADIKLSAACSFLLGMQKGFAGLLIGLVLAIIVNLIKAKDKKAGFPMIPYLAVGFLTAYFI